MHGLEITVVEELLDENVVGPETVRSIEIEIAVQRMVWK